MPLLLLLFLVLVVVVPCPRPRRRRRRRRRPVESLPPPVYLLFGLRILLIRNARGTCT